MAINCTCKEGTLINIGVYTAIDEIRLGYIKNTDPLNLEDEIRTECSPNGGALHNIQYTILSSEPSGPTWTKIYYRVFYTITYYKCCTEPKVTPPPCPEGKVCTPWDTTRTCPTNTNNSYTEEDRYSSECIDYYRCNTSTCDDNQTLDTSFDPPKCMPTVPTCEDNETLDTSFNPPQCVPTCQQEDVPFPQISPPLSIGFNWDEPNSYKDTLCLASHGQKQESVQSCETHYRCVCTDVPEPTINKPDVIGFSWGEDDSTSGGKCTTQGGEILESQNKCTSTYHCKCTNRGFPQIASNQEISKSWSSSEDYSAECLAQKGEVQSASSNCKTLYRCVKETQSCPTEGNENISSYVSPRDGTFHEDIPLLGVDFNLHYNSAEWNTTSIAHGWSVSASAWLVGDRLHYGSGSLRVVDTSMVENGFTIIKSGSNEMLFDANGRLQSIRDLYTKETKTTFSYDFVGRLVTLTDIYGENTTIKRDTSGQVEAIVAPTGQRTFLKVNSEGDLAEIQYEDTSSYAFEYERHLMTVETEPNGNRFLHFFDDVGNVVKVIDAEQGEWNFGSTTADTYGSHTVTRASGDVVVYKNHFLENNSTLRTQKILPTGDIVEYVNAIDDSSSTSTSCGMTTTNTYKLNADGSLYLDPYTNRRMLERSRVTTPSGLSKLTLYDKSYTYLADGSLASIVHSQMTNAKVHSTTKDYVTHTEVTRTPEGKTATRYYDAQEKQLIKSEALAKVKPYRDLFTTTYRYDSKGKLTQEKTARRKTKYTYDSRGNLATLTDAQNKTTTYTYDTQDRLSSTTYPDGNTEYFSYDSNGNLLTRTVPTPATHSFGYNGVNRRTSMTSPLGASTTYTYDKQRRVIQISKTSGKSIETTYSHGRVTAITTPEATTRYEYSCQSNIASIKKPSTSSGTEEHIDYTYDGTLLTQVAQSGSLNQAIEYSYNDDFLLKSMTYAGATQNYLYNKDDEAIQMGDVKIGRRANKWGTYVRYAEDSYRLNDITPSYRQGLHYYYDNRFNYFNYVVENTLGQIYWRFDYSRTSGGQSYRYTYDKRGRLTKACKNSWRKPRTCERYTYDANGNRQSATINGVTTTASYTLDDQLIVYGDNSYRYDEDGYLAEKTTPQGTTTYNYGTLGELHSVSITTSTGSVTVISYQHNALNQRVAKLVNGEVVEKYLWQNLTTLLAVYDKNDNLVQRFTYTDKRMPLSMTDNENNKYNLHYDQVGTLRAVSDTRNRLIKEVVYDTFGNILNDSNPSFKVPFGFAGGLYDADTELTRFGYRDYDAYTGKWTAKDPIGFQGGDSNLYGYVLGDPVNLIDPNGLCTFLESIWSPIDCINDTIEDVKNPKLKDFLKGICRKKGDSISDSCTDFSTKISDKCLKTPARGLNTVICGQLSIDAYNYCTRNLKNIPICKDCDEKK